MPSDFFTFDPNAYDPDWNGKASDIKTGLGKYKAGKGTDEIDIPVSGAKDYPGYPEGTLYCYNCAGALEHLHEIEQTISTSELETSTKSDKDKIEAQVSSEIGQDLKVIKDKISAKVDTSAEVTKTTTVTTKIAKETKTVLKFEGDAKNCETIVVPYGPILTVIVRGLVKITRTYDVRDPAVWTSDPMITYDIKIWSIARYGLYPAFHGKCQCDPCKEGGGSIVGPESHALPKPEGGEEKGLKEGAGAKPKGD